MKKEKKTTYLLRWEFPSPTDANLWVQGRSGPSRGLSSPSHYHSLGVCLERLPVAGSCGQRLSHPVPSRASPLSPSLPPAAGGSAHAPALSRALPAPLSVSFPLLPPPAALPRFSSPSAPVRTTLFVTACNNPLKGPRAKAGWGVGAGFPGCPGKEPVLKETDPRGAERTRGEEAGSSALPRPPSPPRPGWWYWGCF